MDIILQNHNNTQSTTSSNSHLEKLLLSSNNESNYNSLHIAIVHRNLLCVLLLLQHAKNYSSCNDVEELNGVAVGKDCGGMIHPLQLLHGTLITSITLSTTSSTLSSTLTSTSESQNNNLLNSLTQSLDFEQLTPLQLLGKTSIQGLSKCRESISLDTLREVWNQQISSYKLNGGGVGQVDERYLRSQGQHRRRGDSSSSSSSDEDILNDNSEGANRILRSGSFNVNEEEVDTRRIRSGSFNILEDNDENDRDGADNDLRPLGDVDFSVLGDNNNRGGGDRSNQHSQKKKTQTTATTENDYGCEVLTFGRADNCALGVPQFTTTSYSRGSRTNDKITDQDFTSSNNGSNSYKPKRVESFSLGELRRNWSSSNTSSTSTAAASDKVQNDVNQVDSPAVSIAASTHHTLVSTRSGQLYSFGYGKGGRLGTGDEIHRPLPTRILGSLTKRIVASIAAAENHSLCSTNDGKVFAWGSNGFGQLGYSTSGLGDGDDNRDGGSLRTAEDWVEVQYRQRRRHTTIHTKGTSTIRICILSSRIDFKISMMLLIETLSCVCDRRF